MLAGLQEYQFQQEAGGNLSREDLVDTVRRAIQRATALTQQLLTFSRRQLGRNGSPSGRKILPTLLAWSREA